MIKSKIDLKDCLEKDSRCYTLYIRNVWKSKLLSNPISDQSVIWRYIKFLRLSEYAINTGRKFLGIYYLWRLRQLSYKTGFQIPPNVFESGLTIYHWGPIIINEDTKIGINATLQPNIVIGRNKRNGGSPVIGDNVYICSGAKVFGSIKIGDNVRIGPNCCVYKDVPDNCIVVGDPAYIIFKDGQKVKFKL